MCANFAHVPFLTAEKGERSFSHLFGLRMPGIPRFLYGNEHVPPRRFSRTGRRNYLQKTLKQIRFFQQGFYFFLADAFAFGLIVDGQKIDFALFDGYHYREGNDTGSMTLSPAFRGDGHTHLTQSTAKVDTGLGIAS